MTVGWTDGRLNRMVVDEARSQFPGVKVSEPTLRRWIQIYNATGDGGLAVGPTALIEFRGRPHKPRRRGNRSRTP